MRLVLTVLVATIVALAGSCSGGGDSPNGSDGNSGGQKAVAAAKCSLPVKRDLGMENSTEVRLSGVSVEGLGEGRFRVTGQASLSSAEAGQDAVPFVCEVAPDASDKLRGLKVTRVTTGVAAE